MNTRQIKLMEWVKGGMGDKEFDERSEQSREPGETTQFREAERGESKGVACNAPLFQILLFIVNHCGFYFTILTLSCRCN